MSVWMGSLRLGWLDPQERCRGHSKADPGLPYFHVHQALPGRALPHGDPSSGDEAVLLEVDEKPLVLFSLWRYTNQDGFLPLSQLGQGDALGRLLGRARNGIAMRAR